MNDQSYVLITAARNEEAHIERTLQSISNQTCQPDMWVIISDGSTDRTDALVKEFAAARDFVRFIRIDNDGTRTFSSQAFALNTGYDKVKDRSFDFVGFLDADISLEPTYYEHLLKVFAADPRLGVAGGEIFEPQSGRFAPRFGNSAQNVAGAIQFFRRQCFQDIGAAFVPLQYGGHDFVANAMARKAGWEVRSISGLPVFHHRPTGTAGTTRCIMRFRVGLQDYYMGYEALFAIGKCLRRVVEHPFGIGAVAQFLGYTLPWLTGRRRSVPEEFVDYLRQQQLSRMFHRPVESKPDKQTFRKTA
jgi:hypothetical protein